MTLPLLAVSSDEVVIVLKRAGFTVAKRTRDSFVLTHGYRDVVIPIGPLGEGSLRQLLRTAGISYSAFLDLLESEDSGEIATTTQIRARAIAG